MKRKFSLFLIVCMSISLMLSGCTTGVQTAKAADLMENIQAAEKPVPGTLSEESRESIRHFSAELLKASADNTGNILVSPASAYLALAMTLNGADGDTKTAMLKVLADQGLTVDQVNQACRDWTGQLKQTNSNTKLSIANSIWYGKDFKPYKPFLQANADYYSAEAHQLDLQNKNTPNIINDWVKKATQGKIDQMVQSIDPDVVMYLIDAIYFKSDWQTPFEKNSTHQQSFNSPKGPVETPFMHQNGQMPYFAIEDASGIALPYDDGHFAFFAVLPDGQTTPREWLVKQDQSVLYKKISGTLAQKSNTPVQLALPKFGVSYEDSLVNELKHMGMEIAFDRYKADFSQMNEQHAKDLFISKVLQKTFLMVDEKGTEAAAATSVEMKTRGIPMSDKKLTFDRPFLYGIMDVKTGLPLFVGIMENPAS
ncbi:serpin family protein [Desulfitobacterium sp. Sab5]|uniref:serpin family protein n=1 Tax=Desulfitobacterium nosdiversum TaxID=3375356 RepID=UPI003CEB567B